MNNSPSKRPSFNKVDNANPQQNDLVRQLEILRSSFDHVSSTLESKQIPETIVKQMLQLIRANGCTLRKWEAHRGMFTYLYGNGTGPWVSDTSLFNIEATGSLLEEVAVNRQPRVYHSSQSLSETEKEWLSRFDVDSILIVPIVNKGKMLGGIELYRKAEDKFNQLEQAIAELFAMHAAAAMENHNLSDAVKQVVESRQQLLEKMQYDSLHDPLTKIANRFMFENTLERAILRKRRNENYSFMVLCIDLDHFAEINEQYGYAVGDQFLKTIALRLSTSVREIDIVARFNSDTFMMLIEDDTDEESIKRFGERINAILQVPVTIDDIELVIRGSIGITISSNEYTTVEDYIHDAIAAMNSIKGNPAIAYQVYSPKLRQEGSNYLALETELRKAISNREFVMVYQPIVSLKDGRLKGMESLVRWQSPERGLVPPDQFIPLAEKTGLIIDIGYLLLDQVCSTLSNWEQKYGFTNPYIVSINISGKQLTQPGFVNRVNGLIEKYNLDPRNLVFEVTESILIQEMERVYDTLVKLNEQGIRVYLDDFGTGYSSLSYLNELPVQAIKLNQSFISDICNNTKQKTLVSTILSLAKKIGIEVIAEGIETISQADCLKHLSCGIGQGFLYSLPLTPDEMVALLSSDFKQKSFLS